MPPSQKTDNDDAPAAEAFRERTERYTADNGAEVVGDRYQADLMRAKSTAERVAIGAVRWTAGAMRVNNLTTRKMECYSITSIAMSEAAIASVGLSGLHRERRFYAIPKNGCPRDSCGVPRSRFAERRGK
jgi:hypothetical protein